MMDFFCSGQHLFDMLGSAHEAFMGPRPSVIQILGGIYNTRINGPGMAWMSTVFYGSHSWELR